MSLFFVLGFYVQLAIAKETLFKREVISVEAPKNERSLNSRKVLAKSELENKRGPKVLSGNLEQSNIFEQNYIAEGSHTVLPVKSLARTYPNLKRGIVLSAIITEGIIALPEVKTPVRAKVVSGPLKGGVFLGEASLENNTKRTLIEFKTFLPQGSSEEYSVSGIAMDAEGLLGLEGEYKSQEGKFFAAEFLSSVATGMAETSISRSQNAWGNYQEEPSMNTITKKAAASSLAKTTDKMAEKVRSAPRYSILSSPTIIQIMLE